MRLFRSAILSLILVLGCATVTAQSSTQLDLSGAVQSSLRLQVADLAKFPDVDIVSFAQARTTEGRETRSRLRGVKLTAIIGRAGLVSRDHNDWKKLIVIASGTDGYKALFSWSELINTPVGDGVLVVFERDGNPLDEREGRISLASTLDVQPGPRRVRNLARVEVRSID